jgi:hypothetical protein
VELFPILDEAPRREPFASYELPLEDWNAMTDLAEHLAQIDANSILRCRLKTYSDAAAAHSSV